jgi:hypothetical protein
MIRSVYFLTLAASFVGLMAFIALDQAVPTAIVLSAGTPVASRCNGAGAVGSPVASPEATPSPVASTGLIDTGSLLRELEARGLSVEETGPIDQPFFNATRATRVLVTGATLTGTAELQVYEYADTASLASDADQVEPDGNLRTVMIEWIAAPHFYCRDHLMVIYLGDDQEALDLLTSLFGPQFAGR